MEASSSSHEDSTIRRDCPTPPVAAAWDPNSAPCLRANPKSSSLKRAAASQLFSGEKRSQITPGPDRHSGVSRAHAYTNIRVTRPESEKLELEGKVYYDVNWYNLSSVMKLILLAELATDRTSMNIAMNMLRMDISERKDYFDTFDSTLETKAQYTVHEDDYQYARRFLIHRLKSPSCGLAGEKRLQLLLKVLKSYRGKVVVAPINPVGSSKTEVLETQDEEILKKAYKSNSSEESLPDAIQEIQGSPVAGKIPIPCHNAKPKIGGGIISKNEEIDSLNYKATDHDWYDEDDVEKTKQMQAKVKKTVEEFQFEMEYTFENWKRENIDNYSIYQEK